MAVAGPDDKPKMTATFDGKGYVLLEIDEAYLSGRSKLYRTFKESMELTLAQAQGALRKRKGAKRFGHYLTAFRFSEVEKELRELYRVQLQTDVSLELEVDFIDEVTGSWPDEEDMSADKPPTETEWWGDEGDQ